MPDIPRLLLAAPSSSSGKTTMTLSLLRLLSRHGHTAASFKCGPDYIDPLLHSRVLGAPAVNLDTFFAEPDTVRRLLCRHAGNSDIAILEGVMGYYDGLAGRSTQASTYDIARTTQTPVVLVADVKGMSLSVVPYLKGFIEYRADSMIQGVILNRCTKGMYPILKELIEQELPIRVLGFLPYLPECELPSRHLGLYLPQEIDDFRAKIDTIADTLEETLDLEALLTLARSAPPLENQTEPTTTPSNAPKVKIAVARDDAFCFYYQDNLDLLQELGAELISFSPIKDTRLPSDISGILLGGGYPENYARQLSENAAMRRAIYEAITIQRIPCLAECGGFLYLHERISDTDGQEWEMAGVLHASAAYQGKLQPHFGYVTLTDKESGAQIRGHEFHYYASTDDGACCSAQKPLSNRHWDCMHRTENLLAGFPHLYYLSNIDFANNYVEKCRKYDDEHRSKNA